MNMTTWLDTVILERGAHTNSYGFCAVEAAERLAGHSGAISRLLEEYLIALNDSWGNERRQSLKPYLPRVVGTYDDGKDEARVRIAEEALRDLLPDWLELIGVPRSTSLSGDDLLDIYTRSKQDHAPIPSRVPSRDAVVLEATAVVSGLAAAVNSGEVEEAVLGAARMARIGDVKRLGRRQNSLALDLLDRLIEGM